MKDGSGSYAVFTDQGSSEASNDGRKSNGCYHKGYQDVQDKQLLQYPLIPKSKWRLLSDCSEFQSQNVHVFGIRLPRHKWPKSWSNIEEHRLFLSSEICTIALWQDDCGKYHLKKF